MTLLKRLQEESRESFKTKNPELFDLPNHSTNVVIDSRDSKCYLDDLDTLIATTVTAVLDEVEEEVYEVDVDKVPTIQDEAWANQFESKAEAFWHGEAKGIENIKAIIQSKRTEI